uniref:Uncharacterized protein n=1 Tax=Arundo donax TaxID=35708 RepID=A0A0A9HM95_ARUDO
MNLCFSECQHCYSSEKRWPQPPGTAHPWHTHLQGHCRSVLLASYQFQSSC